MEIQIKSYLSAHINSVLCILLTPLLQGLREKGLEFNYNICYLQNAVLVEFMIQLLIAYDKASLLLLYETFSMVSSLAIFTEVVFGWTLNSPIVVLAVYCGIRSLLLEIIRLVKDSVKNSFLLWFFNLTDWQWRYHILSRITRTLLLSFITVCILVMRVTIMPMIFIPNSPQLVRPENQIKAIQWTSDIANEIMLYEDRPEFKTSISLEFLERTSAWFADYRESSIHLVPN